MSLLHLLLLLLFISCKPSLPPGILTDSELESVLYDFHIAQAIAETQPSNGGYRNMEAHRYEMQQAVFRKHGITEAEFDSTMNFYCSDIERLNHVYERVAIRMERDAEALGDALSTPDMYSSLSQDGDTANVWLGKKVFAIRNRLHENLQSWQIPCDSTWLPGDDLLWRFDASLFSKDGVYNLYTTFVVVYTNDSIRSRTLTVTNRALSELRINDQEGWVPRTVTGYFYMPVDNDPQKSRLMIINRIALIRFHKSKAWRDSKAGVVSVADTLTQDTLSAPIAEPSRSDSVRHRPAPDEHRLSPSEFRELQPVDRKIDVVKEKPYTVKRRPKKRKR